VERQVGAVYPRRIARDWRDMTVGAGSGRVWLARASVALREIFQRFAEQRNPCPPGTGNHTLDVNPIYREEFQILSVKPLP
jgi:hypothetical protein